MVRDDHIGADRDGLVHRRRHAVDDEKHGAHQGGRLAEHQPDAVPRFGPRRRIAPVQERHHLTDTGHGREVTSPERKTGVVPLPQRVQRELPGEVEYNVGPGIGLTRGSDHVIMKFNLELERFIGTIFRHSAESGWIF